MAAGPRGGFGTLGVTEYFAATAGRGGRRSVCDQASNAHGKKRVAIPGVARRQELPWTRAANARRKATPSARRAWKSVAHASV